MELPYVQGTSPETTSQEMRTVRLLCENVHLNRKQCSTGLYNVVFHYIDGVYNVVFHYIDGVYNVICHWCITSYVTGV